MLMRVIDVFRITATYFWLLTRVAWAFLRRLAGKPHLQEKRHLFELQISPASRFSFPAVLRSVSRRGPQTVVREEFAELWGETISRFRGAVVAPPFSITFLNNETRNAIAYVSAFRNWVDGLQHIGAEAWVAGSLDQIFQVSNLLPIVVFCRFSPSQSELAKIENHASRRGVEFRVFAPLQPAHGEAEIERYAQLYHEGRIAGCYSHSVRTYHEHQHPSLWSHGVPLISIEFAANPLIHFPVVSGGDPFYDFAFLGSTNSSKRQRYVDYFGAIFRSYRGFIGGPGWTQFSRYGGDFSTDRSIYSISRIGLNLSVPSQLEAPRELNERAYQLAACGICQLSDNNPLLPSHFPADAVWQAETPSEYSEIFNWLLDYPEVREETVGVAYRHVMANHTVFHRAVKLIDDLREVLICD